jgi:dihydropteroate synthase
VLALANGAEIFRVHDVRAVREALVVAEAILERGNQVRWSSFSSAPE